MGMNQAFMDAVKKAQAQQNGQKYNPDQSIIDESNQLRPSFNGVTDANGNLKNQFQLQAQAPVTADQSAVDAIRQMGLNQGPSAWAQLAQQQNQMGATNSLNQSAQQNAASTAQAANQLAMRGGVSSGARERLARAGSNNLMMNDQGIRNNANNQAVNIGMQDQQMKNQALGQTAGYDFQNASLANQNRDYQTNVDQKNLGSLLANQDDLNNYNMDAYKSTMSAIAAGRTADAQAQAAKSGGSKK